MPAAARARGWITSRTLCSASTLPESGEGAAEGAASEDAVVRVVDSYVIPSTTKTSDHAPIALVVGLRI